MPDWKDLLENLFNRERVILIFLIMILTAVSSWLIWKLFRIRWKIRVLVRKLNTLEAERELDEAEHRLPSRLKVEMKKRKAKREQALSIPDVATAFIKERNAREPLYVMSSQQAELLMQKVKMHMSMDKPYLDPRFNMNKLCDALQINRTYLSSAINQNTGQRFETFVNTYRIIDAVELLSNGESDQYTLEYISSKVGFQSKSTFNRSFKQFTGINPSFFQKVILQDPTARKVFFEYFNDLKLGLYHVKPNTT